MELIPQLGVLQVDLDVGVALNRRQRMLEERIGSARMKVVSSSGTHQLYKNSNRKYSSISVNQFPFHRPGFDLNFVNRVNPCRDLNERMWNRIDGQSQSETSFSLSPSSFSPPPPPHGNLHMKLFITVR